jgi:phosphoenolpyruvate-protein kinase (PTS system EI component)
MNPPARFTGQPVSEGTAEGTLQVIDIGPAVNATPDEVAAAFGEVSAERFALADRLREAGREQEAGIIEVGALIAADPALSEPAITAVRGGQDAGSAVREAAEKQARAMEGLANRELAERAGDIRQVAQAVLERLGARGGAVGGETGTAACPPGGFIIVRREVSPADLIQYAEAGLVGAVSVTGGASSHAAIVARGLGLPMITGTDPAVLTVPSGQHGVLTVPSGQHGVLNADSGELLVGTERTARTASAGPAAASAGPAPVSAGPPRTADGREITVLCNVASAAETRLGLAEGAAGIGLLRTEIPYAQALAWPTLADHRAQLTPILGLLADRTATVRLLDFSGDKVPPFLRDASSGGLAALLDHPTALGDQLRAMLETGQAAHLGVLIPMVSDPRQVSRVRDALVAAAAAVGVAAPRLGIMVELESTAADAGRFATVADFFSIGTNDLTGDVLGLDRRDPSARPALAAHPRVLGLIGKVAGAGREAGIEVSVCGDSAADPLALPLLIGAGVRTLSVPAARVRRVRSWVTRLDAQACAELTTRALRAGGVDEVWNLVRSS